MYITIQILQVYHLYSKLHETEKSNHNSQCCGQSLLARYLFQGVVNSFEGEATFFNGDWKGWGGVGGGNSIYL